MSLVKGSAVTFGGYLYQNLVGIEFLCDWLDDPLLYDWIRFESDQDEHPRGLDDIVLMHRVEKLLSLFQVKFTVDPTDENNQLTWDWLLTRQKKGSRTLLEKWANAFYLVPPAQLLASALITNRIPATEFAACLSEDGNRIDINKIPAATYDEIAIQLGDRERAKQFFSQFEFRHSHKRYETLERELVDRFVPIHTTIFGWLQLRNAALGWSLWKNTPPPDGRITLDVVRATADRRRPAPISQSFRVPETYSPPDQHFDKMFQERIACPALNPIVLWGSPGQGKSTYLSYLCKKLALVSPVIRHHYFLELTDTTDRFSFVSVANSLMAQMEISHSASVSGLGTNAEDLRSWIEACGRTYARKQKRFVVVIDGLDHVWRENERDKSVLDSLFRHLLPVPENVTLVLGTQRVSSEQLPRSFARFVTQPNWIELPSMSLFAVNSWLRTQHDANRFEPRHRHASNGQDALVALADAFHEKSQGHPLHLAYSFEALVREMREIDVDDVKALPDCPDGDIRSYYAVLWEGLSLTAKDALRLMAASGFIWPEFGIEDCLGAQPGLVAKEIGHLFYSTQAGPLPFHGSVLAFIRELPDHDSNIERLNPSVIKWLETKAPRFHQWGWLWLFKARGGNADELFNGATRDWIIESEAGAYPNSQTVAILEDAERRAFFAGRFAIAIRFRWMKMRLQNGVEFQIENYNELKRIALAAGEDSYLLKNLSARISTAKTADLYVLGKTYVELARIEDASECQEELRRRINDRIAAGAFDQKSLRTACNQYLSLAAATGSYDPIKLVESIRTFRSSGRAQFRHFLRELGKRNDVSLLLPFLHIALPLGSRRDLECALVRVAAFSCARLHELADFRRMRKHPIVECWARINASKKVIEIGYGVTSISLGKGVRSAISTGAMRRHLHCIFFEVLARSLALGGAQPVISPVAFENREWLTNAVETLQLASAVVGGRIARGDTVTFNHCFRALAHLGEPTDYESRTDLAAVRSALVDISVDLALLMYARNRAKVPLKEWKAAAESTQFNFETWRQRTVDDGFSILAKDELSELIEARERQEAGRVSQFNERADYYLGLADLAQVEHVANTRSRLLRSAVSCVMSYGWRKDMTAFHVLSAIDSMSKIVPDQALTWLKSICPAIDKIDEFTDGDETRHAKTEMADLLLALAPRTYVSYYEHLLWQSEWYEAEQVLSRLLATEPLESPAMQTLCQVLWGSSEVGALRKRASAGDLLAQDVVSKGARRLGLSVDEMGRERFADSPSSPEPEEVDGRNYGPTELPELVEAIRRKNVFVGESKTINAWFEHWTGAKRGSEVLATLEQYLDEENVPSGVAELFDKAFELSRTLKGPSASYKWIVAAQVQRHGWDEYWPSEPALERFRTFARYYAKDWQKFVWDTSRSAYRFKSHTLVIPHHRLVAFLVEVGQIEVAREVTSELVASLLREVAEQPLSQPHWLSQD